MEVQPTEKHIPTAISLNIVLPGAGYWYMGRRGLGVLVFVLVALMVLASPTFAIPIVLVINIVMAIDMVMMVNKQKAAAQFAETRACPYCAELILKDAKLCKHCRSDVALKGIRHDSSAVFGQVTPNNAPNLPHTHYVSAAAAERQLRASR